MLTNAIIWKLLWFKFPELECQWLLEEPVCLLLIYQYILLRLHFREQEYCSVRFLFRDSKCHRVKLHFNEPKYCRVRFYFSELQYYKYDYCNAWSKSSALNTETKGIFNLRQKDETFSTKRVLNASNRIYLLPHLPCYTCTTGLWQRVLHWRVLVKWGIFLTFSPTTSPMIMQNCLNCWTIWVRCSTNIITLI